MGDGEKKHDGCQTIKTKHGHTIEICPQKDTVDVKEK